MPIFSLRHRIRILYVFSRRCVIYQYRLIWLVTRELAALSLYQVSPNLRGIVYMRRLTYIGQAFLVHWPNVPKISRGEQVPLFSIHYTLSARTGVWERSQFRRSRTSCMRDCRGFFIRSTPPYRRVPICTKVKELRRARTCFTRTCIGKCIRGGEERGGIRYRYLALRWNVLMMIVRLDSFIERKYEAISLRAKYCTFTQNLQSYIHIFARNWNYTILLPRRAR